jgi:hypothetical protein
VVAFESKCSCVCVCTQEVVVIIMIATIRNAHVMVCGLRMWRQQCTPLFINLCGVVCLHYYVGKLFGLHVLVILSSVC